jgi:hypothetical protein
MMRTNPESENGGPMHKQVDYEVAGPGWRGYYTVAGTAMLFSVLVVVAEILIGFLPGVAHASQRTVTVIDWFTLFQNNWFLGLRNLGLLNLIGAALLTPAFLAMYFALRRESEAWAALGVTLFFMGMAIYLAENRAFAMLSLSGQFARAATEAQRTLLGAAGQAMLVEGSNRVGLFLIDAAGLVLSAVMLRSKIFGKATAYVGVVGNGLMIVLEMILASAPGWSNVWLIVAMCGGVSIMAWYLLVGRRLFQMGAVEEEPQRGKE